MFHTGYDFVAAHLLNDAADYLGCPSHTVGRCSPVYEIVSAVRYVGNRCEIAIDPEGLEKLVLFLRVSGDRRVSSVSKYLSRRTELLSAERPVI